MTVQIRGNRGWSFTFPSLSIPMQSLNSHFFPFRSLSLIPTVNPISMVICSPDPPRGLLILRHAKLSCSAVDIVNVIRKAAGAMRSLANSQL